MRVHHSLVLLITLAVGCGSNDVTHTIPSQLANDPCSGHDQASCAGTCEWVALGADAMGGTTGVCVTPDPCRAHADEASCAVAGCAWAGIATLCPAGADCNDGGFCYTPTDDNCVCACPAFCPPGEDCPPCSCDCSGGGTTCTCESPACPPGQMCPPSTCDCGGSGCSDAGTCTCACPACEPGQPCPPCDCSCGDGGTPTPAMTTVCECAPCPPGEVCPACACPTDPCTAHSDDASCAADTANACSWIALGIPCMDGADCMSGVCQHVDSGGGSGCGCACPACPAGEVCPPCDCAPMGGSGSGGGTGGGGTPAP